MAAFANARAKAKGLGPVINFNHDEFVILHCDGKMFIVYRDVVTEGANYFQGCFYGFCKETRDQEVHFGPDSDVYPDELDFYLNIAHGWFFEIKLLGTKVVSADIFKAVTKEKQEEPLSTAGLEIPRLKLAKMAETVVLADRFIHRSLLSIMRQMFLSLLDYTHMCWELLKYDERNWDTPYHQELMYDYIEAFFIFSRGYDDEKLIRDAIIESFYWLTVHTPSLGEHFAPEMSLHFIHEWKIDRTGLSRNLRMEHALGLFRCDQLVYASHSRKQKERRDKRILNTCPPEQRGKLLLWLDNPRELKKRTDRLRNVIAASRLEETGFADFTPGALAHQASASNIVEASSLEVSSRAAATNTRTETIPSPSPTQMATRSPRNTSPATETSLTTPVTLEEAPSTTDVDASAAAVTLAEVVPVDVAVTKQM
ncbi:hypothetical protein CPLU01_08410 [Colletotrichum plurivorum]|uniref:BTB domain-containing protein n=1 Tax=Colletotrichum plurivorum TaxID=2175906 RepID=A0A8H6KDA3_9PEZI|nr:hypothetical protein CPLU01_08410 [Colletotrichum plurivorum]